MVSTVLVPGPQWGAPFFLVGALVAGALGVWIVSRAPRSGLHRSFALVAFAITLFDGGFVFVNAGTDHGVVWLAYRIASVGFCFLPLAATLLVFHLVELRPPRWFLVLLGLGSLAFLIRSWTGVLYVSEFVLQPHGNGYLHAVDSPWYWAFQATYLVHGLNLALLVWKWSQVRGRRLRAQFSVLTLSYVVAVLLHFLQSSLPSMTGAMAPWVITVVPVNALLVACQAWAIVRYRFLGLEEAWVDWQVLRHTRIPVVQLDPQGRPVWSNPAAVASSWQQGDQVRAEVRTYPVHDRRGAVVSTVVVGPRPPTMPVEEQDEADLARLVLAGWSNKEIASALGQVEGTVKNRLSRLYRRWGVSGRAELRRRYG